jgi:hypothetical protein
MTGEQIESILRDKNSPGKVFEIRFKVRSSIRGLFINTPDYKELGLKNLWRVVSETHIEEYKKTSNENLARIFNGTEFTKLEVASTVKS